MGILATPEGPPVQADPKNMFVQDRLVSLVAEHLLDSNNEARLGPSVSMDYKANLQRNIADAITLLPKLTTGIDVNVRPSGIPVDTAL